MTRILLLFFVLMVSFGSFAQVNTNKRIIDTLVSGNDSIVIFADKSWEYMRMLHFDGVTNPYLNALAQELGWKEDWVNDVPYTYANDLSAMSDTVWLCIVDDENNEFCMPHPGMVTSTFKYRGKRFHYGTDVDVVTGDTIYSAFNGIVRYAQFNEGGFGNLVIIRHFNGLETYYAHLSQLLVSPNQQVKAGDVIGLGGNTGHSFGDHLHFEVRLYGNALDPEEIIDFEKNELKKSNLLVNGQMFTYSKASKSYASTSTSSSSSSSSKTSTSDKSSSSVHVVKSGDSLYYIALKHNTTVSKLCKLNGMKETDILHIGDKIKLK